MQSFLRKICEDFYFFHDRFFCCISAFFLRAHARYLIPVLSSISKDLHWTACYQQDEYQDSFRIEGKDSSIWAVMSENAENKWLQKMARNLKWKKMGIYYQDKSWTDERSNVLGVLRRKM